MYRALIAVVLSLCAGFQAAAMSRVTVLQLDAAIEEMHSQGRNDEATANRLKEMELGERMSSLDRVTRYQPGPQTMEQLRILMLSSAMLAPPASELPSAAAPDTAMQMTIMGRAVNYTTKLFSALPTMTVDKVTARYQNGADHIRTSTGYGSHTADADLGFKPEDIYLHALGTHLSRVEMVAGVELAPARMKGQDPAGQNGQISQNSAGPNLGMILADAAKGRMGSRDGRRSTKSRSPCSHLPCRASSHTM